MDVGVQVISRDGIAFYPYIPDIALDKRVEK